MKKFSKLILLSSLLITNYTAQAAQEKEANFSSIEVSPGIFMLMGVDGFTGGNIGLSVGEDGIVMIDDSMPPFLDKMNSAIKSITNKPVDFLINTHVHGDHTGNNEAVGKNGTHIVAHENLRRHLLKKGVATQEGNKPAPKDALPVITFSHSMDFHLNGEDAHIFHVSHAHTDGDAVIHFKNANVIHAGDTFFNGLFPYIDLASGGSVDGYIKAQQKILSISNDKTKIIPGHGPLASKADLQKANDMLVDAKKIIAKLIKKGQDEEQIVKADPLNQYAEAWSWGFINTEKMTRQIYKGLTSEHQHEKESQDKSHGHSH